VKTAADPRRSLILSCIALAAIALSLKITLERGKEPTSHPPPPPVASLVIAPLHGDAFSNPGLGKQLQTSGETQAPPAIATGLYPVSRRSGRRVERHSQLTVKAILRVGQRVAYVSIDGQEAVGFHAGEFIGHGIQVTSVSDDHITVRRRGATVTLSVGQRGDL
jgi:hypothetical protein